MIIPSLATESRTLLERAIESRAKVVPVEGGIVIARVLGDLLMYLNMKEITLAPTLAMNGYWEFWVTQAIARHVKPGMTCVDVGANVGYFTMLMAALVGPAGSVSAYDPGFQALVELSADVNGFLDRVKFTRAVVSEEHNAERVLHVRADPSSKAVGVGFNGGFGHYGHATLHPAKEQERLIAREQWQQVTVDSVTLDAEFPEGVIDFIKVDAEGSEPLVWRGSRALRDRCNPVLCMEHDARKVPGAFLEEIRAEGYRIRFVDYTSELVDLPASGCDPSRLYMLWLSR